MVTDVAGQPLYAWDADDREFHFTYDELRRPLTKEVTISSTTYVLEETVYGEGQTTPETFNLRGQVYQHYDNAGMSQVDEYDFKGLPIDPKQQLLDDHTIVHVDWAGSPTLDTEVFTTSITTDALGRPVSQTDAGGNITEYTYDKAGALKTVEVNTDTYVADIHYNARGQREAIWYGNGTKTAYTYDAETYRLTRLLTTKSSNIYQDLLYWYDPVGNITQIQDDAQQTLYYSGSVVAPDQDLTYDALYRLIRAEGRVKGKKGANSAMAFNDADARVEYENTNVRNSKEAVSKVREAAKNGDVGASETAARDAVDKRNQSRLDTRAKQSRGSQILSEKIEPEGPTYEQQYDKYKKGAKSEFEVHERIAKASGRSRGQKFWKFKPLKLISQFTRVVAVLAFVYDVIQLEEKIRNTPKSERAGVIAKEIASILVGAIVGFLVTTALAAFRWCFELWGEWCS